MLQILILRNILTTRPVSTSGLKNFIFWDSKSTKYQDKLVALSILFLIKTGHSTYDTLLSVRTAAQRRCQRGSARFAVPGTLSVIRTRTDR